MTDAELLMHQLRNPPVMSMAHTLSHVKEQFRVMTESMSAAADRIEALAKDQKQGNKDYCALMEKYDVLQTKLAKAVDALRLVTDACDEGTMVLLGTSGMTIDAQIRRSVYNKVPAWPIEEARVVLEELEK